jgi:hypothetical protein
MERVVTNHLAILCVLLAASWLSAAQAEDETEPAYGVVDAVVICKKTPEGMKVSAIDTITKVSTPDEIVSGPVPDVGNIAQGDWCLRAFAQLPRPILRFAGYFNAGGNYSLPTNTIDYIFRPVIRHKQRDIAESTGSGAFIVSHIAACAPDGDGNLVTVAVYTDGLSDLMYTGLSCGETLKKYASEGAKIGNPVAGSLGYDAAGNLKGGLAWVLWRPDDLMWFECNLNTSGSLVVTGKEAASGVDTTSLGQSCLATLSSSLENGWKLKSVTPATSSGLDSPDSVWVMSSVEVDDGRGGP